VLPIVLLAAIHGIALAVRAGASSRSYHWAVSEVALIGMGAFAVSFLALRDLMHSIGYSPSIAWVFPAIIDTTLALSTLILVALGDKPVRRSRAVATSSATSRSNSAVTTLPLSAKALEPLHQQSCVHRLLNRGERRLLCRCNPRRCTERSTRCTPRRRLTEIVHRS
jgi:hypothetical protein